jgi:hypothetical protein
MKNDNEITQLRKQLNLSRKDALGCLMLMRNVADVTRQFKRLKKKQLLFIERVLQLVQFDIK